MPRQRKHVCYTRLVPASPNFSPDSLFRLFLLVSRDFFVEIIILGPLDTEPDQGLEDTRGPDVEVAGVPDILDHIVAGQEDGGVTQ